MAAHDVHIVGSVPMPDAETVFRTIGGTLGPYLKRLPDGETGERLRWIFFLERVFSENPVFEPVDDQFRLHENAVPMQRYRIRDGVNPADIELGNLLYADNALASWDIFRRLRDEGAVPADCRFQVDFAPGHSPIRGFVADEDQPVVEPLFDEGLKREIDRIAAAIPHGELAMQFDTASAVFFHLERGEPTRYGATKAEMRASFAGQLVNLGDHVPPGVELLYHMCYGDNNHRHTIEPTDTEDMVAISNIVSADISRTIELIHMPVPRGRDDDAYFAPLKALKLRPETGISLGLVHYTDGVNGTRRRIKTARKYLGDFSVATECGFGRRDPATLPELLRIHAEVAEG